MGKPTLSPLETVQSTVDTFGGWNHNLRIGDGEFYETENLSTDKFPVLSVRQQRHRASVGEITGMAERDGLAVLRADVNGITLNGHTVLFSGLTLQTDVTHSLVSMGAYLIILPEKIWINTMDTTQYGKIDAEFQAEGVTFSVCQANGSSQTISYTGENPPENPENLDVWLDTGSKPHTLKQWSETSSMWVSMAATYVKLYCTGIGERFEVYDGVRIDGLADIEELRELNGTAVIWDKGDDYLVITGLIDAVQTVATEVTISRKMPDMDFVIESGNRLWGCRYGLNGDNEVVNELYACKLGDFKNWNCFMGISTDSYAVSLGTDGVFTGAVTHGGYPIFFKEGYLHKVYGQLPSNFQVQTTACRGIAKGSSRSAAIVNEVLYYLGTRGVCAYDGSLPVEISAAFGEIRYQNGVGAAYGNKYYLSAEDESGESCLLVYDSLRSIWQKENGRFSLLCPCRGELLGVDGDGVLSVLAGTGQTVTSGIAGSALSAEGAVHWMAETGIIGCVTPEHKYLTRINLRMQMDMGSWVKLSAEYDSCGGWVPLGYMAARSLKSFTLPVRPRRCDHLRLRLEGEGGVQVFAVTKTMEQGSDIG